MGALDTYDDMMGLEFGALDEIFNMQLAKEFGMAGVAGGASILAASYLMQKVAGMEMLQKLEPATRTRVMSGLTILAGAAVGRGLYYQNRDAAMAVAGGLVGLGMANLVGSWLPSNPLGAPLGALPEEMALNGADDQMLESALAEAGVSQSAPAFGSFQGPTVTREALQGTMVEQESLGYAPYLA